MGCESSKPTDLFNDEYEYDRQDNREFRSKYDILMDKLRNLKNRAIYLNHSSSISDIEWIISTVQEKDLFEPELINAESTSRLNQNGASYDMQDALDVLAQYSYADQNRRLQKDAEKIIRLNESKAKKPIKYAGFINKFKRSVSNIVTSLSKKENFALKDLSPEIIQQLAKLLSKVESYEFNIFEMDNLIGKRSLYFVMNQILSKYGFFKDMIDEGKFLNFADELIKGYDRNIPYHNDLHATDVIQTTYMQIEKGNLIRKLKLIDIDLIAVYIAAACHDYKHNGFNNNYQVNVRTDIAITFNDAAVLENYHVSEAFKTILKVNNNLFDRLSPEEFRHVRRRMIECILATDMASHTKHMFSLRSKLESLDIKDGRNVEKLLVPENAAKNFENLQMILNACVHTSDVSNPAKIPEVFDKWTDLVYQEFFNQGDMEKSLGVQMSMLCDRQTTKIKKSQVGFINFVVIPQFELVMNFIPEIQPYYDGLKENFRRYELMAKEEEAMMNKQG